MSCPIPTTLALYDPNVDTKVSANASSYGLGAVLLQKSNSTWRQVAFASHSLSETEQRYAQIEKEVLAIAWSCDKFAMYLLVSLNYKPL